jgi:hypothetical protein
MCFPSSLDTKVYEEKLIFKVMNITWSIIRVLRSLLMIFKFI